MLFLLFLLPIILAAPSEYYKNPSSLTDFTKMTSTFYIESGKLGLYLANQFDFSKLNHIGYLGFQPRDPGPNVIIFSAFGKGPTTDSPNCNSGADGGNGVSCGLKFPWKFGQNNTIEVERTIAHEDGNNTWQATLIDEVTGERTIYGNFTTPKSYGLLKGSGVHFDEWFPFNSDGKKQSERGCVPKAEAIIYLPTFYTEDGTAVQSELKELVHQKLGDACELLTGKTNGNVSQIGPYAIKYENGVLNDEYSDQV